MSATNKNQLTVVLLNLQYVLFKAQIPREQFPRSILVAKVTRKSLTSGVSGVSDEDATRILRGNCFSGI